MPRSRHLLQLTIFVFFCVVGVWQYFVSEDSLAALSYPLAGVVTAVTLGLFEGEYLRTDSMAGWVWFGLFIAASGLFIYASISKAHPLQFGVRAFTLLAFFSSWFLLEPRKTVPEHWKNRFKIVAWIVGLTVAALIAIFAGIAHSHPDLRFENYRVILSFAMLLVWLLAGLRVFLKNVDSSVHR